MSVRIHWRPAGAKTKSFKGGTSNALEKIKRACGEVLTASDLPILRAMELASGDTFYGEVADVVLDIGDIEIWGEY